MSDRIGRSMNQPKNQPEILRHKAARKRKKISPTVRAALDREILTLSETHLDYGCGKGDDVRFLQEMGFNSTGFDPYWHPGEPCSADVVTLGFVLNVIECRAERDRTLIHAYSLAKKSLIISAIVGEKPEGKQEHADGIITKWQTFEKYFGRKELREYVESIIGVRSQMLDQEVLAIPKVDNWKPLEIDYKPGSISFNLKQLREEKSLLQRECFLPDDAILERYSTTDKKFYYRLRSQSRSLPGKNGFCKCLHLGKEGSDRYLWGVNQLETLNRILLASQRILWLEKLEIS